MAVLTGNKYEQMLTMIDYFMNDRARNIETMLDHLDPKDKKLSEQQYLNNSIWYLGHIAVPKLLSPSHSKESISLRKIS